MTIQRKLELVDQDIWITENVSPQELYDLINNCEDIRMCLCERCKYYKVGTICMKHPSVCITEDMWNPENYTWDVIINKSKRT